ncbi:DUF3662 domain-containing protein [candidate division KSB1 bacterium]|nr:DUF3662 domain-containing protein [candidate division KSB1 bacterium]
MGLKDKAKGMWKRVSVIDDDMETADNQVGGKERIPYKEISKKLKEVMKQNVDVVGRRIIIPSYYAIFFNEADRNIRIEVEDVLCDELKEELHHEMRKINPEQNKRELVIKIQTDINLVDGQFRIEYHINKPQVTESTPQIQTAVPDTVVSDDNDFKQTVIEQTHQVTPDDAKTVVMQRPTSQVLYTLLVDSGEGKQEIEITKPVVTIGRGSKDDVILESPDFAISRAHATLAIKDNGYYLTPVGINGTILNGTELELNQEFKINPGDEVMIMNYRLKIL